MRSALSRVGLFGLVWLVGCGGSCGTDDGPVPGGFPADRKITRAAQVRLTAGGLDVLAQTLSEEATRGLRQSCSIASDCPEGFVGPAGALTPHCGAGVCREAGAVAPYIGLPVPPAPSGLQLCPAGGAPCAAAARLAGFELRPRAGAGLTAALDLQVSGDISVRSGAADCVVRIRPPASPQPVTVDVDLGVHPPSGAITVGVGGLSLNLPASAVTVAADPLSGDRNDAAQCAQLDPGPSLLAALEAEIGPRVQGLLTGAFGWSCNQPGDCPNLASCDATSSLCVEDSTGRTLGAALGYETRLQLPALLGELGYRGTSGLVDTAVAVGGSVDADAEGLSLGLQGGLEAPRPNPACATVSDSPVTRPGFVPPAALPGTAQADLDWDGAPETDYDIAFGASQALLQQVAWGVYTSGLFCGVITHADFDGLTTGALELIIPSVRILARSHLFPRSEAPARLSVYMRSEPRMLIGSGEVTISNEEGTWTEPLARLDLDDVEINLSVLVDERYVRVMTITLDLHIGIGALVTPNNAIEPVLGVGVADLITDVRVTNSELLAEPPQSLETAIPTLVSLIVLELSGSQGEIDLPRIPGLDLTVLGLRGEPASGPKHTVAVYANAQPETQGNLRGAADTRIAEVQVDLPQTEAFRVTHPGGPVLPKLQVELDARVPEGAAAEFQVRLDGGPWSPYFGTSRRILEDPALLLQGEHVLEARARVLGDYKTLDPSPARTVVVIDSVPPTLDVQLGELSASVEIWDRIGPVRVEVVHDGERRVVEPGQVELPELEGQGALSIEAIDGAQNVSTHVIRAASAAVHTAGAEGSRAGGCTSATPDVVLWVLGLVGVLVARPRR